MTFPFTIAASAVQMQVVAGQHYDQSACGGAGEGSVQGGALTSAFMNMRTVAAFSVQHKVCLIPLLLLP